MLRSSNAFRRRVPLHHPAAAPLCGAPSYRPKNTVRSWAGAGLVALAVLAQGWILSTADEDGGGWTMVAAGVAACALAVAWLCRGRVAHLDALVATAAVGGLAMLAGAYVQGEAAHPHAMHAAVSRASSLGTVLMLAACAGACRWTCAPLCGGRWPQRTVAHVLAAAGMVAGMAAGRAVPASGGTAAGAHLAMVLGMTLGLAAVLPVVRWMDGHARLPTAVAESASA
jgi:hypothetical protein